MENYDAIIIGGGHNGLLTGAYLAKAGARVLIIERRWEAGGAVMTDEQSGFRINTHACYMMMDNAPAYDALQLGEYGCTYFTPQPTLAFLTKDEKALCWQKNWGMHLTPATTIPRGQKQFFCDH